MISVGDVSSEDEFYSIATTSLATATESVRPGDSREVDMTLPLLSIKKCKPLIVMTTWMEEHAAMEQNRSCPSQSNL